VFFFPIAGTQSRRSHPGNGSLKQVTDITSRKPSFRYSGINGCRMENLSSFVPNLWTSIAGLAYARQYAPGATLFEHGEPAAGIFMIRKGEVRVWIPEAPAQANLVTPVGAGTMLGLSKTLSESRHKISAVTLSPTEVDFVPRETLLEFLRDHHEVCLQVVRVLSEDLHGLYHRFQTLNSPNPRARRAQPGGRLQ